MTQINQKVTPARPVPETNRCPFCGGQLETHCELGSLCAWLRCSDSARCNAYGPASGMVRI